MDRFVGIRAESLEQARQRIESATGIRGIKREHDDMGGEYYEFPLPDGNDFVILRNLDLYEAVPFTDPKYAEWKFVAQFAEKARLDKWVDLLATGSAWFKELRD